MASDEASMIAEVIKNAVVWRSFISIKMKTYILAFEIIDPYF